MKPLYRENQSEFDNFIPSLEDNPDHWHFLSIAITDKCEIPYDEIIAKVIDAYNGFAGIVYNYGYYRILCLVKLGIVKNHALAKQDLAKKLPQGNCFISLRKLTKETRSYLRDQYMKKSESDTNYYEDRYLREGKKILVVDDDAMQRRLIQKIVEPFAVTVMAERADQCIESYKTHNPDAVFMDIHMPGKSGLDILENVFDVDPHAFVVVFSSDRVEEKVLEAVKKGAAGFIGKPVEKAKVMAYLRKCITLDNITE